MFFSIETLDLVLYCVQQLGIMLAVGAETIVLVAYILSMRDGVADPGEVRFSRIIHRALIVGIGCIIVSGVIIVLVHNTLRQADILTAPVFLFKWLLIVAVTGVYFWQRKKAFSHYIIEGLVGATWYSLFLVHILAPLISWINLLTVYVGILVLFSVVWFIIVQATRTKLTVGPAILQIKTTPPVAAATPVAPIALVVPPPPPPPAPPIPVAPPPQVVVPPPVIEVPPVIVAAAPPPPPVLEVPVAATVLEVPEPTPVVEQIIEPPPPPMPEHEPHNSPWLPAIHVMPRTQRGLDNQNHIRPLAAITKTV